MSKIILGHEVDASDTPIGHRSVCLDLRLIVRKSHLLIQANSGGGKSWAIRRLVEQAFGKIQIFVIDPEGEFSTLREKHDFLLVGKGGDIPADIRSAGLLARRLREMGTSAIFDLFEMPKPLRHQWLKLFFEALIDLPKNLWNDLLLVLDEAQLFAPEKGEKPSVAADAVADLAGRGRKRGILLTVATPRLAVLDKDVAATCGNVLIGQTYLDHDRERAAKALALPRAELRAFYDEVRKFPEGVFFGQGRAISLDRIRTHVGPIETTHGEDDRHGRRRTLLTSPTPEAIKHLLSKLADLPQEAEAKAKTEVELRTEIRRLESALAVADRAAKVAAPPAPPPTAPKIIEKPIILAQDLTRLERAIDKLDTIRDQTAQAQQVVVSSFDNFRTVLAELRRPAPAPVPVPRRPVPAPTHYEPRRQQTERTERPPNGEVHLKKGARLFLQVLANVYPGGMSRNAMCTLAGSSPRSSTTDTYLGILRSAGYVERRGDDLAATAEGHAAAGPLPAPRSPEELLTMWTSKLKGKSADMLRVIVEAGEAGLTREEVMERVGGSLTSSSTDTYFGLLRGTRVVTKRGDTFVAAPELLGP